VAGLLLLAVLGRIAIDVTAEPLLEIVAQLTVEPEETGLLRRVVSLLEAGRAGPVAGDRSGDLPARLPERLVAAFEQGQLPLLKVVSRLSEITQTLEETVRASVKAFETILRSAAAQQRPINDDKVPELQAAVEELTAVLRRFSAGPENVDEATSLSGYASVPARRKAASPGLARELRGLLQEIDAAR
jgi:hypothetical protein